MARFVDLDLEENEDEGLDRGKPLLVLENGRTMAGLVLAPKSNADGEHATEEEETGPPIVHNAITEAFACYPTVDADEDRIDGEDNWFVKWKADRPSIVMAVVSHIDLNTLDALARTSRSIHDNLFQFRKALLNATLRCSNETGKSAGKLALNGRLLNGGPGHCARDMVGECRKCDEVICRNCAIKPPASPALRERHRRLCRTCSGAPIGKLASPPLDAGLPFGSDAVQRSLCKCEDQGVWLCQPCGRNIRNSDHDYKRIWRWRNQYGEILGGLGTGIGEGDRGVVCGREGSCLAARVREYEVDCDAEDLREIANTPSPGSQSVGGSTPLTTGSAYLLTPGHHAAGEFPFIASSTHGSGSIESLVRESRLQRTPSPQLGPGYNRHEIEGIGGVVKRKLVKMVRVGACVPEWAEERGGLGNTGKAMEREAAGVSRSWCGWCWRAVPGQEDKAEEEASSSQRSKG